MRSTYAQWLKFAAYTLLITAVVVGGYYFVYVQQRSEQLANDRLALLQESSAYFAEELGRVKRNIVNTLRDTFKVADHSTLDAALGEISGITHTLAANGTESRCLRAAKEYGHEGHHEHDAELSATFNPSVSHPHLTFGLRSEDGEMNCPLARANPDSLLIPLLPRSDTAFDKVVLAGGDGQVLVSTGSGSISIVELPLRPSSPSRSDTNDNSRSDGLYSAIFTVEAAGVPHRIFLQPFTVPVDLGFQGAGANGKTSVQEGKEKLYLAGVKQEQAFQAEARRLPPTLLYGLLGLVAVALLAFPFLQVWLIGATEPFQAHDLFEVAIGVVITSSIATLAVMSAFCTNQLKQQQFQRLDRLSNVIRNTVRTEVEAASRQLAHLTTQIRTCDSGCTQRIDILADPDISDTLRYPHLEMASWINDDAVQEAKWSVEDQTTPLVGLSNRGYVRAHEAALKDPKRLSRRGQVWRYMEDDSTHWVLESIRSKNTGEVFAQISQRLDSPLPLQTGDSEDNSRAVIAAATLPLLSLIDPVLPPGHRFALIDNKGRVLFHSDTRRNLRENIFDKLIGGAHLRDAVYARREARATAQYRETAYQFYSHPLENSPWTLLVFADLEPLRAMHGHILTSGLGVYVGYLLLLALVLAICVATNSDVEFGLRGLFYSLWPDRRKTESYRTLLWWEGGILAGGLVLFGVALWSNYSRLPLLGVGALALCALSLFCYHCTRERPVTGELLGGDTSVPWPNQYYGSLFLLVVIIGVLPVAVSYTVLHDESAELLVKKNQRAFAQRIQGRGDAWVDYYRRIALGTTARTTLSKQLFPEEDWGPTNFPIRGTAGTRLPTGPWEARPPWDVHVVPGLLTVGKNPSGEDDGCFLHRGAREAEQPVNRALDRFQITDNITRWGHNLHVFSHATSSDTSWSWVRSGGGTLTLCVPSVREAGLPPAGSHSAGRLDLRVSSPVPTVAGLFARQIKVGLLVILGSFLLLGLLWWGLRKLLTSIYFIGLGPVVNARPVRSPSDSRGEAPERVLFLRGEPEREEGERSCYYIDASGLRGDELVDEYVRTAEDASAQVVVVENFHEGLWEAEVAETKRTLLEGLADLEKGLEVYSDIDPLPYLRRHFHEEASTGSAPIDLSAWATLLRAFRTQAEATGPKEECRQSLSEERRSLGLSMGQAAMERLDVLAEECRADPYLCNQIGREMAGDPQLETLTEEQIVEEVKYRARAHYQHLWMTCSDREKVVLYRLSTDGFASPHGRRVVKQLLRRGLLVMDPVLRPMNQSFGQFVADLDSPAITQYKEEASSTTWNRVRAPLLIAFAIVIGFVFATQPNIAKETAAIVPTLAAGLPALINILSSVFGGGSALRVEGKSGSQNGSGQ